MHTERWFTANFMLNGSTVIHTCELFAWGTKHDGNWNVGGRFDDWPTSQSHANLWIAIGTLFDDNDAVCLTLKEIDRAGNRI